MRGGFAIEHVFLARVDAQQNNVTSRLGEAGADRDVRFFIFKTFLLFSNAIRRRRRRRTMKHKLRPLKHDIRRVDPFSRRPGKQNAIARRPERAWERERQTDTERWGTQFSEYSDPSLGPFTHTPDGRFTRRNHARRTRVTRVLVVVDTKDTAEKAFNYRVGPQSFLHAGVSGREKCEGGGTGERGQIGLQHHHRPDLRALPPPDTAADGYCLPVQGSVFFAFTSQKYAGPIPSRVRRIWNKKNRRHIKPVRKGETYTWFDRVYTIRFERTCKGPVGLVPAGYRKTSRWDGVRKGSAWPRNRSCSFKFYVKLSRTNSTYFG